MALKGWIAFTSPRVKLLTLPPSITLAIWPAKLPTEGTVPNLFSQTWLLEATSTSITPQPKHCVRCPGLLKLLFYPAMMKVLFGLQCCGTPGLCIFCMGEWEMTEHQHSATGLQGQGGKLPLFDASISWEEANWKEITLFQPPLDTWVKAWQPFSAGLRSTQLPPTALLLAAAIFSLSLLVIVWVILLLLFGLGLGFFVVRLLGLVLVAVVVILLSWLALTFKGYILFSAQIKGCWNPSWSCLPAWGVSSYLSVGGSENGLGCLETWLSIF